MMGKRRFTLIIIVCLMFAMILVSGCLKQTTGEKNIPFESTARGSGCWGGTDYGGLLVITKMEEWIPVKFECKIKTEGIDFQEYFIIAAFVASSSDVVDSFRISNISQSNNEIRVTTFSEIGVLEDVVPAYHVVKVKKSDLLIKGNLTFIFLNSKGMEFAFTRPTRNINNGGVIKISIQETNIPFETMAMGDNSEEMRMGNEYPAYLIITNYTDWENFTLRYSLYNGSGDREKVLEPSDFSDFENHFLIVAFRGYTLPGHFISIINITQQDDLVKIIVSLEHPESSVFLMVQKSYYHIVKVRKSDLLQKGNLTFIFYNTGSDELVRGNYIIM